MARGTRSLFMHHQYEDTICLPYTKAGRLHYREAVVKFVNLKSPSGRIVKRNISHEEAHVEALLKCGWELTHDAVNVGMIG